jgi:hypothetical protein
MVSVRPGLMTWARKICEARALALEGSKEKLVATMTGTLMAVIGRQDISQ